MGDARRGNLPEQGHWARAIKTYIALGERPQLVDDLRKAFRTSARTADAPLARFARGGDPQVRVLSDNPCPQLRFLSVDPVDLWGDTVSHKLSEVLAQTDAPLGTQRVGSLVRHTIEKEIPPGLRHIPLPDGVVARVQREVLHRHPFRSLPNGSIGLEHQTVLRPEPQPHITDSATTKSQAFEHGLSTFVFDGDTTVLRLAATLADPLFQSIHLTSHPQSAAAPTVALAPVTVEGQKRVATRVSWSTGTAAPSYGPQISKAVHSRHWMVWPLEVTNPLEHPEQIVYACEIVPGQSFQAVMLAELPIVAAEVAVDLLVKSRGREPMQARVRRDGSPRVWKSVERRRRGDIVKTCG